MSAGLTSGGDTTGSTGSCIGCIDGSATTLISVSLIGEKKLKKAAYHILRPILRRWVSRHRRCNKPTNFASAHFFFFILSFYHIVGFFFSYDTRVCPRHSFRLESLPSRGHDDQHAHQRLPVEPSQPGVQPSRQGPATSRELARVACGPQGS